MVQKRDKEKFGATAKVEAVAKVAYRRTRTTTEIIPPDVTRAKAGKWLDLISPITEWAGLKGDALRHRRQQLRIQQEAALDQLAHLVQRKMRGRKVVTQLPPKIIVPALEAASLEQPESPLIDWWANLLVSGATGDAIRPYFVDLMKALGPYEAACLDKIWKSFAAVEPYRDGSLEAGLRTIFNSRGWIDEKIGEWRGRSFSEDGFVECFYDMLNQLGRTCEKNGALTELSLIAKKSKSRPAHVHDFVRRSDLLEEAVSIEICFALKLLEERGDVVALDVSRYAIAIPDRFEPLIGIRVIYPSKLGVEFLSACNPISANTSKAGNAWWWSLPEARPVAKKKRDAD